MRMVDDWRKRKFYAAQPKLGCGGRHALAALQYSNFSCAFFTEETVPATEISAPSCDAFSHYDSDDVTDNRGDRQGKPSAEHDAQGSL
jgi:hypothetical protein